MRNLKIFKCQMFNVEKLNGNKSDEKKWKKILKLNPNGRINRIANWIQSKWMNEMVEEKNSTLNLIIDNSHIIDDGEKKMSKYIFHWNRMCKKMSIFFY